MHSPRIVAALALVLLAARAATADPQAATPALPAARPRPAAPHAPTPPPPPAAAASGADGVPISGPARPTAPEVVSRDGDGRATCRANRLSRPLRIDGQLDENVYRTVPSIGG